MTKKTTPKDSTGPFRLPEEMDFRKGRRPRSIRFNPESELFLEQEARRVKVKFASFISQIIDDYVDWLRDQRK